jgi:hypothetical protein
MGKLTYDQVEQLLTVIVNSNTNLRTVLNYYSTDSELGLKTNKLLQFCNELDRYVENLKETVALNKDVDSVIDRLKQ